MPRSEGAKCYVRDTWMQISLTILNFRTILGCSGGIQRSLEGFNVSIIVV